MRRLIASIVAAAALLGLVVCTTPPRRPNRAASTMPPGTTVPVPPWTDQAPRCDWTGTVGGPALESLNDPSRFNLCTVPPAFNADGIPMQFLHPADGRRVGSSLPGQHAGSP